jgi:L-lactate dehydrogenase (cytochrome)
MSCVASKAAAKYGTMFGVSSLGTVSLEELRKEFETPQVYQFYFHKDRGLNRAMMQRAKDAGVNVMMLTVDSITGGNRERDLRTGFSIPFRLTPGSGFRAHPNHVLSSPTAARMATKVSFLKRAIALD